jgi:hypothetical protein
MLTDRNPLALSPSSQILYLLASLGTYADDTLDFTEKMRVSKNDCNNVRQKNIYISTIRIKLMNDLYILTC